MSSAGVELPTLQSLVNIGGTYDAPVHHVTFSGITFTGTSWRGPSSNEGYVDQQTGAYIAGNWNWPGFGSCHNGCAQFEAARPHWLQMPAAVQISAANSITLSDSQFVNLGQTAIGIGNDANAHASGVGLGAGNITITGPRSPGTPPAASWSAACAPTRTIRATSAWSTGTSRSATTASTTSGWTTGASCPC
jgi:hypothetical protein